MFKVQIQKWSQFHFLVCGFWPFPSSLYQKTALPWLENGNWDIQSIKIQKKYIGYFLFCVVCSKYLVCTYLVCWLGMHFETECKKKKKKKKCKLSAHGIFYFNICIMQAISKDVYCLPPNCETDYDASVCLFTVINATLNLTNLSSTVWREERKKEGKKCVFGFVCEIFLVFLVVFSKFREKENKHETC